jgi:tRNA(Ile)-lysidine synthase
MQPLGLSGHKKISDILTDKKINTSERKSQLVLLDANKSIIALLPSTCSEAHKISQETTQALAIYLKYH